MKNLRKIVIVTVIFSIFSGIFSICVSAQRDFDGELHTQSLLLTDLSSGQAVFEKGANEVLLCASTTKIMTYIVTVQAVQNLENTMVEITKQPFYDLKDKDASMAGFKDHIGEKYSVLDILRGMMLVSGCDAAQILARYIGQGDDGKFVEMMNEKAAELGCEKTHFENAHGLSDVNYSTARELAVISQYALGMPYFRDMVKTEYYTLPRMSEPMINNNYLIDDFNGRQYYYKYAIGVKTGFTTKAGRCLVSLAHKGDKEYLCVALNGQYDESDNYQNHAMLDSRKLFEWAFDNFTENVDVSLSCDYKSLVVGGRIKLIPTTVRSTTGDTPVIKWTSSDNSVATVDQSGIVTGVSLGDAKIVAETQTGNIAVCHISVGYYNGVDVNSNFADRSGKSVENINWGAIKQSGMDFAVIRAGWSLSGEDADFECNTKSAAENGLSIGLSFVSYAEDAAEAADEANHFLQLVSKVSGCRSKITLPVAFNMTADAFYEMTTQECVAIAKAFSDKVKLAGFDTMVYASASLLVEIGAELLENGIGMYLSYCPDEVNFKQKLTVDAWLFRGDGYILAAADQNLKTRQCLVYTDNLQLLDKDDVNRDGFVNIEDVRQMLSLRAAGYRDYTVIDMRTLVLKLLANEK